MPDSHAFQPGDRVLRHTCDFHGVQQGHVYIVESIVTDDILRLVGQDGTYSSDRFAKWQTAANAPNPTGEADPTGRDAHSPGAKLDQGKASFDYVLGYFPNALAAVNEVADVGARKYTPGGWVTVPDGIKRYGNAGIRHRLARLGGEDNDKDTKLLHAAHEAWNALAVLELILKERK